jgi:hypothetical protein
MTMKLGEVIRWAFGIVTAISVASLVYYTLVFFRSPVILTLSDSGVVIQGIPFGYIFLSILGLSAGNIYRTWTGAYHTHRRDGVARPA